MRKNPAVISTDVNLPDPDAIPFVAVALATPDRTIVTGSPGHFPAADIKPARTLSPRTALDILLRA